MAKRKADDKKRDWRSFRHWTVPDGLVNPMKGATKADWELLATMVNLGVRYTFNQEHIDALRFCAENTRSWKGDPVALAHVKKVKELADWIEGIREKYRDAPPRKETPE